jgi:light-regulated signal transduction histidine kinase (bacteriophytochrome)
METVHPNSILGPDERATFETQASALEALVAERTRDLAATVKELEAFSYSVAHDLRAPLRAVHSFSRLLLEDYADRFDGEPLDFMQRILRASERMSHLIDDLLKLSQVGRGKIERVPVDLSAMVTQVAAALREREPARDVRIDIETGVLTQGDYRLLMIAFENLLENAWKFTRRREVASIRFYTADQDGRRTIRIADNGTGFDMRYHDKLFAPFQRLHHAADFEGTGIGLVTVARIIARHGGEVAIDGADGVGATVSVVLPEPAGA